MASGVMRITEAELLDALAVANAAPAEARTCPEIARDTGVPEGRVRLALKKAAAEGRLQVHRVTRPNLGGTVSAIPAYTITKKRTA